MRARTATRCPSASHADRVRPCQIGMALRSGSAGSRARRQREQHGPPGDDASSAAWGWTLRSSLRAERAAVRDLRDPDVGLGRGRGTRRPAGGPPRPPGPASSTCSRWPPVPLRRAEPPSGRLAARGRVLDDTASRQTGSVRARCGVVPRSYAGGGGDVARAVTDRGHDSTLPLVVQRGRAAAIASNGSVTGSRTSYSTSTRAAASRAA